MTGAMESCGNSGFLQCARDLIKGCDGGQKQSIVVPRPLIPSHPVIISAVFGPHFHLWSYCSGADLIIQHGPSCTFIFNISITEREREREGEREGERRGGRKIERTRERGGERKT